MHKKTFLWRGLAAFMAVLLGISVGVTAVAGENAGMVNNALGLSAPTMPSNESALYYKSEFTSTGAADDTGLAALKKASADHVILELEEGSVAAYDDADVERILNTEGMIRSPRKVLAVINNAQCYRKVREEYGSFCDYIWSYSNGKTILYRGHDVGTVPVSNGLSDRISRDLKKRGFKYVGAVTIYSHLQACGIINDHDRDCPCFQRINDLYPTMNRRRDHEVK